jgi:hypothetical protein
MGADDQLLDEVAAMYEGLRRARQTMELWLRVSREDPAAPDAESIIRRLIRDVSEVLAPIEERGSTRYVPPEPVANDSAPSLPAGPAVATTVATAVATTLSTAAPVTGERQVPEARLTSVG